jgi:hypothetical protein
MNANVGIVLYELSSSHMFSGRCALESVKPGHGLDSIKTDDILMKIDGADASGNKNAVMEKLKVIYLRFRCVLVNTRIDCPICPCIAGQGEHNRPTAILS